MFQSILIVTIWFQFVNGAVNVEWSLNQKLKTIENSLISLKNSTKFSNISHIDNFLFIHDETKAKRTYENARCIKDLQWIQQNINNAQNGWAYQLLDTWGNFPSGDSVVDHGRFENCRKMLPMTSKSLKIQSQYCLLNIYILPLRKIQNIQSFSELGICIPDSCAPTFIKTIMTDYLNASKSVQINIPVDRCQLQNDNTKIFFRDKLMIVFIFSVFLLIVLGTIHEAICYWNGAKKNSVLLAFSALSNGRELCSCETSSSQNVFFFFHGIRVISCSWIIFGHTIIQYNPSSNYSEFIEFKNTLFKHIHGGTLLCVDSFFVLGGILVSISILKRQSNSQVEFCSLIFQRIWRVLPVMAFVAFFQLTLFKFLVSGPLYREVDSQRYNCEQDIWKTLFFVSNYYRIMTGRVTCLDVSWYTSVDMQLFILAPFLLILMKRNERRFVLISVLAIAIDFLAIIGSATQNEDTLYLATHHRFPAWLIGLNFGYFLHKNRDRKFAMPKYWNILAMIGSLTILALLIYSYLFVSPLINWTYRIIWSLALCYIIFACAFGFGGVVNRFLSKPVWHPLSRLSFVAFLIEGMVMTVVSQNRQNFSKIAYFQLSLFIIAVTNAIAMIVALMIEMPMAKLKTKLFT